jgi:hypothetical protein
MRTIFLLKKRIKNLKWLSFEKFHLPVKKCRKIRYFKIFSESSLIFASEIIVIRKYTT